ncbi:DNA polymerase III subunit gamma/tau [Cyclobacteriaceae bacterium YHN15]|nr:DNA polymerase III subunit gamma/tau [Cyclobacteriaceae bacterium YHN15]
MPVSLSAAKKTIQEKPKTNIESDADKIVELPASTPPQLAEVFDLPKLQQILFEIMEEYRSHHKNLEVTVLKQPVTLDNEIITFHLNGEIQQDIFLKIKPEILNILRRKLNNYSIHIEQEIKEEDLGGKRKLYTSTDKLLFLKGKSPALIELQKRFGLETDF